MSDHILLTGVCYIHRLLQLRFSHSQQNRILDVHPNFDLNKIRFFQPEISQRFLFTDFHGRYSSLPSTEADLYSLLRLYNDRCRMMYVVGAAGISSVDLATILTPADYQRLSTFWYFLFDENWNPHRVREWAESRDQALLRLLKEFPKLKFVFYQPSCVKWWNQVGLPSHRYLFWNIDWGMTPQQFEEIRRRLLAENRPGNGHRFPTEESYNELCDLILHDFEHSGAT